MYLIRQIWFGYDYKLLKYKLISQEYKKMKKNFINLCHPQRIDIKSSNFPNTDKTLRKSSNIHFSQLPQQSIKIISSYLRLNQIITLYSSLKYCHRYQEIKNSILNYLILTNRMYTKWEQKQFIDLLIHDMQSTVTYQNKYFDCMTQNNMKKVTDNRIIENNENINKCINSRNNRNSENHRIKVQNCKYNPNLILNLLSSSSSQSKFINGANNTNININSNKNDKSRLTKFKQSIVYDVNRTYFKKVSHLNRNIVSLPQKYNYINNQTIQKEAEKQRYTDRINNENKNNNNNMLTQQHIEYNTNSNNNNEYYITMSTQSSHVNINKIKTTQFDNNQHAKIHVNKIVYSHSMQQNMEKSNIYSNTNTNMNMNVNMNALHIKLSQAKPQLDIRQKNQDIIQQESMQNYLKSVLINITYKYPNLGYIQGFNYIVKNMYITGLTQQQSYKYLSYLIQYKQLGNILINNMQGIKQLSYVLKVYIFNYIPKVYKYLHNSQLEPQIFCTSWFVTLFSQDLSFYIVNKLWHLFILEGWKIFIKFGIALICAYQQDILECQCDQLFSFMRRIMEKFNQQIKQNWRIKQQRDKQKQKCRRNNYYFKQYPIFGKSIPSKKQQIVWKLMTSIEIHGNILNQLCREMNNLEKDSQIQIWRLQTSSSTKNLHSSRIHRTFSEKYHIVGCNQKNNHYNSISKYSHLYSPSQKMLSSNNSSCGSLDNRFGEQLCCDRANFIDSQHVNRNEYQLQNGDRKYNNNKQFRFALCQNVGPYID